MASRLAGLAIGAAAALTVGGLILVVEGSGLGARALPFATAHLSRDGTVTLHGADLLVGAVRVLGALLAASGLGLLALTVPGIRRRAATTFLTDPAAGWPAPTRGAVASAVLPCLVAAVLCCLYHLRVPVGINDAFAEDGLFEHLTVVGLVAGSLLAAAAAVTATRRRCRTVAAVCWILVLACLVVAGEELSWGQRIFGWSTPEPVARLNTLGETNLHNMVTGWFDALYGAAALLAVGLTLAPVLVRGSARSTGSLGLLLPHPSLLGVTVLMAVNTLPPLQRYDELFEELTALLAVAYLARLLRRLRFRPACGPAASSPPSLASAERRS